MQTRMLVRILLSFSIGGSGNFSGLDQLDESLTNLSLSGGTLALEGIRDWSGDVQTINTNDVTATFIRGPFHVIDNVVTNDVLLDDTGLSCDYCFTALAGTHEFKTTVSVLRGVVDLHNASVGHQHGHLNVVNKCPLSFVIGAFRNGELLVHLGLLDSDVGSEGSMLL